MREIAILGAGELGGATAHALARANVSRTVTLIDERGKVAAGKALDILQAAPVEGFATQLTGATDPSAAGGAEVVIVADRYGAGEWPGDDAVQWLRRVAQMNPRAFVICAGAGGAELVARAATDLGLPRTRVIGTAPEALAGALRAMVALAVDRSPGDVALTVLGVPPRHTVVPWQDAALGGLSLARTLDEPTRRRLDAQAAALWPPGPFALAAAATAAVTALVGRSRRTISAFVAPDVSAGLKVRTTAHPIRLGPRGLVAVLEPDLSAVERIALDNARLL